MERYLNDKEAGKQMKNLGAFFCTTVKTRDAQLHPCAKEGRQSGKADVVVIEIVASYGDDTQIHPAAGPRPQNICRRHLPPVWEREHGLARAPAFGHKI